MQNFQNSKKNSKVKISKTSKFSKSINLKKKSKYLEKLRFKKKNSTFSKNSNVKKSKLKKFNCCNFQNFTISKDAKRHSYTEMQATFKEAHNLKIPVPS